MVDKMKKIYVLSILITLTGCAEYNPEVLYPITNINDFYKQCKESENINLNPDRTLSYSDRYYCLGYVQAMSEASIYFRKQEGDINPKCQITVRDFYYSFIKGIEQGRFRNDISLASAFQRISYDLCPKLHNSQVQYIEVDDFEFIESNNI